MLSRQANIKQISVEYNEVVTKDLEKQKAGRGAELQRSKECPPGKTSLRSGHRSPDLMKDGGAVAISRAQGARQTWRQACGCWAPGRVRMSVWLEWREEGGEWARARPRQFGDSFPGRVTGFGRGRIRFAFTRRFRLPVGHRSGGAWMAREDLSRPAGSCSHADEGGESTVQPGAGKGLHLGQAVKAETTRVAEGLAVG